MSHGEVKRDLMGKWIVHTHV